MLEKTIFFAIVLEHCLGYYVMMIVIYWRVFFHSNAFLKKNSLPIATGRDGSASYARAFSLHVSLHRSINANQSNEFYDSTNIESSQTCGFAVQRYIRAVRDYVHCSVVGPEEIVSSGIIILM